MIKDFEQDNENVYLRIIVWLRIILRELLAHLRSCALLENEEFGKNSP
jgi:hypothetical protein